jgi:hypothetical protein
MAKMLGKLPYVPDSRSLKLSDYLTGTLPTAPSSYNWDHFVHLPWGMCLNDTIGDCAIAGPDHLILAWTSSASKPVVVPDQATLTAYSAVSGYNPVTQENDNGCQLIDVLKYWRSTGIDGHTIGAFAEINVKNLEEVKSAIDIFGGVDIGVQLPLAAQQMGTHWTTPPKASPAPQPWWMQYYSAVKTKLGAAPVKVDESLTGNWAPGSWGGHCVVVLDYSDAEQAFTIVSWGELIKMDYGFFKAYCDEAWAVVSKDILNAKGEDVQGLDLAKLTADLAEVK